MKIFKIVAIYLGTLIITLGAAVFQRMTGPTHPFKESIVLNDKNYQIKLMRSMEIGGNQSIELPLSNNNIAGIVSYRIYPSNLDFIVDTLRRTNTGLAFSLPEQKAAGKVEYSITLTDGNSEYKSPFLLVRYKDAVPAIWLVPHIILMFLAMFFAVAAGLMVIFKWGNYTRLLLWSGVLLFIGGIIFGCIVQKYAFGEFWTGIPFGWDLTDNKTLITLLVFAFAIFKNYKKPSKLWTIIAVVTLLAIYSIPHSLFGSELDQKTGEIKQSASVK